MIKYTPKFKEAEGNSTDINTSGTPFKMPKGKEVGASEIKKRLQDITGKVDLTDEQIRHLVSDDPANVKVQALVVDYFAALKKLAKNDKSGNSTGINTSGTPWKTLGKITEDAEDDMKQLTDLAIQIQAATGIGASFNNLTFDQIAEIQSENPDIKALIAKYKTVKERVKKNLYSPMVAGKGGNSTNINTSKTPWTMPK